MSCAKVCLSGAVFSEREVSRLSCVTTSTYDSDDSFDCFGLILGLIILVYLVCTGTTYRRLLQYETEAAAIF
jgi:hypothetical protein